MSTALSEVKDIYVNVLDAYFLVKYLQDNVSACWWKASSYKQKSTVDIGVMAALEAKPPPAYVGCNHTGS